MLNRVLTVSAYGVKQKEQILDIDVDEKAETWFFGDDQRLAQVITNLLSNASKFTPEGGRISLTVKYEGVEDELSKISVKIVDTGIGISGEQREKLFQSFSQADSSIGRNFGGTGLGLVISKRIVELMGGDIFVESMPGEGSTFHFTVLLGKGIEVPESDENAEEVTRKDDFSNCTVLVAEDIEINRIIVATLLDPTELKMDFAVNGVETVEKFSADPDKYDLILMDVQMPEMDGLEATETIRAKEIARAKKIPIVAMTANVFREDIDRCLKAGMDDHLGKPIDHKELLKILRKHLY
jgi:CheY-like chemotaxis protein